MTYKKACLVSCTCVVMLVGHGCGPGNSILGTWEDTNGKFKVRVVEYDQTLGIPPQRIYCRFEAAGQHSTEWREIMTSKTKSGITREHVKFIGDNIAYIFTADTFASTVDTGRNWSVFDGDRMLRDVNLDYRRLYIRTADISPDGTGVIEASVSASRFWGDRNPITLHTSDYGQHWTK